VRLCIFAYTRVTCTFASFPKFVAGAHCVWRLTAASALALPLTCLFLCLLQASTSLHSTTIFAHARFSQNYIGPLATRNLDCFPYCSRNSFLSLFSLLLLRAAIQLDAGIRTTLWPRVAYISTTTALKVVLVWPYRTSNRAVSHSTKMRYTTLSANKSDSVRVGQRDGRNMLVRYWLCSVVLADHSYMCFVL